MLLLGGTGLLKLSLHFGEFAPARSLAPAYIESMVSVDITPRVRFTYHPRSFPYNRPLVDVWSIGCIFAELLTGKPLFKGKE